MESVHGIHLKGSLLQREPIGQSSPSLTFKLTHSLSKTLLTFQIPSKTLRTGRALPATMGFPDSETSFVTSANAYASIQNLMKEKYKMGAKAICDVLVSLKKPGEKTRYADVSSKDLGAVYQVVKAKFVSEEKRGWKPPKKYPADPVNNAKKKVVLGSSNTEIGLAFMADVPEGATVEGRNANWNTYEG